MPILIPGLFVSKTVPLHDDIDSRAGGLKGLPTVREAGLSTTAATPGIPYGSA